MGAGLRPTAKAGDMPPDPTVGAPALYPNRESLGELLWHTRWQLYLWQLYLDGGLVLFYPREDAPQAWVLLSLASASLWH